METYSPSLDWGSELGRSLWWIAQAWGICAVVVVVICVLLARYTVWGRQFWRITGAYFTGPDRRVVWGLLALLLLSVVCGVRLDVLFSYYGNDLYSSLQAAFVGVGSGNMEVRNSGIDGFWDAIRLFCLLATIHVARVMLDIYLMQRFIIRWRVWLTGRLTGDWLSDRAYYRTRFLGDTIDNPDQRIQLDIDIFTTGFGSTPNTPTYGTVNVLLFGAVEAVLSVAAFTTILWKLSGPLTLFGVTIEHALFWIAWIFVIVATVVAFWIGKPFIRLSFRNELFNAGFRYALVRLRDSAESIAFYRGERAERNQLDNRFAAVIANYRDYLRRTIAFTGWNLSASQSVEPIPFIVQAPRLFAGDIQLGDVTQSASAFRSIQTSLSYFRTAYDNFASYRAAIIRLHGLVEANAATRKLPELATEASTGGGIELAKVEVRTPDGTTLVDNLELALSPGESMVITGQSGVGKSTLLRSLAELWPYASGTIRRPDGDGETMFLGQMPYVPLGNLRAVVSYPADEGDIDDETLQRMLIKVALPNLAIRLNDAQDWAKVLSPGEQQRIAFARVLLSKPKALFLDEATSALDEGLEHMAYSLLSTELPDCIVVSVSHHRSLTQHHEQQLELLGGGQWRHGRAGEQQDLVKQP